MFMIRQGSVCALSLAFVVALLSCQQPGGAESHKGITAFSFQSADNPGLTADTAGEISGTSIVPRVPFGADVRGLVARFTTTGVSVEVNGAVQESGVTAHDFSSPVTYTVIAQDGSTKQYTVTAGRRFTDDFNRADSATLDNGWIEVERGAGPQSAASIKDNTLLFNGGFEVVGGAGNPYSPDVKRDVSLSGSFQVSVRVNISHHDANRFLIALVTRANNNYFLGYLNGMVYIWRDSAERLCSAIASINEADRHTITVSKSASRLSLILHDDVTGREWTLTSTDNAYQEFSSILLRGGYFTSFSLNAVADDFVIQTP